MKYRCLNNPFGYCSGKPDPIIKKLDVFFTDSIGRQNHEEREITICSDNSVTCGHYQTFTENLAQTLQH